ncbi:unnamed protein product [Haemonchus placei]|uniref:RNF169 n=1 Tax=Haemonchus placei TaxID=6290 RepID=A0A0N4XB36_HAEPC|nr:unnamed protein product [Haemonchus placei]
MNEVGVRKSEKELVSKALSEDLEYGPGIVEKLRAKFQRLSGIVSRDAKVSPHATGKRCPSVDDILSTSEEKRRSNRSSISSSGQSPVPLSSLSRHQSRSTGDMINAMILGIFVRNSQPQTTKKVDMTSHIPEAEPAVFVRTDDITSAINSSPPPEEPKPRVVANDYIPKACAAENSHSILPQTLSQRITPHNEDEIGVTEMQRLLHKFQRARDERQLEEKKSVAAFELPSNLPSSAPKRNFVHAVVGVRLSGSPTTSDGQPINGSLGLNKPNVVNISVRSDTSTLPSKQSKSPNSF